MSPGQQSNKPEKHVQQLSAHYFQCPPPKKPHCCASLMLYTAGTGHGSKLGDLREEAAAPTDLTMANISCSYFMEGVATGIQTPVSQQNAVAWESGSPSSHPNYTRKVISQFPFLICAAFHSHHCTRRNLGTCLCCHVINWVGLCNPTQLIGECSHRLNYSTSLKGSVERRCSPFHVALWRCHTA